METGSLWLTSEYNVRHFLSPSLLLSLAFASNISIWIYIQFIFKLDDCNISRESHLFINFLYIIYSDSMKKHVYKVYGEDTRDRVTRVRYFCRRRYLLIQIENM